MKTIIYPTKKLWLLTFCLVSIGFLYSPEAKASHIVGGNFELKILNAATYQYRLSLFMFFDELGNSKSKDASITIGIYRKSDNARMATHDMPLNEETEVVYAGSCAGGVANLKTQHFVYFKDITLDPSIYNDPQGYYAIWQRCCRNSDISNIVAPGQTGQTFYMEFPPVSTKNSSPHFDLINGEYICANFDFKMEFGAIDSDNDELRYTLVTPYQGQSNGTTAIPAPPAVGVIAFKTPITWLSGYSASNPIHGSPSLSIDSKGVLTVKANQIGLFVFTVECSEWRAGVQIGLTRRDYQLKVLDCSPPPPPPPIYTEDTPVADRGKGISTVNICKGTSLLLQTKQDPNYTYQWQKDGDNIAGEDQDTLRITKAGTYTVLISYSNICSKATSSEKIIAKEIAADKVSIIPDGPTTLCSSETLTLTANPNNSNWEYLWMIDSDTLRNEDYEIEKTPKITTYYSGNYSVSMKNTLNKCKYVVNVDVVINDTPFIFLTNVAYEQELCKGDSIDIMSIENGDYTYSWFKDKVKIGDNLPHYVAKDAGIYWVSVVDINGCKNTSDTLNVIVHPVPLGVTLDSIPPVCSNQLAKILLVGKPDGGYYDGNGVNDNIFNPSGLGFGNVPVTYTYTNEFYCSTSATRNILVGQSPRVSIGNDLHIFKGNSIQIKPFISDPTLVTYQWTPPTGLSDVAVANPVASPNQTTIYKLKVTMPSSCSHEDEVVVNILPIIDIPTGFTPNNDGVNDVWDIANITNAPNAEVEVFNRWGQLVYASKGYSKPFDGTYEGSELPVATYYYVIRPNNGADAMKGNLTIIR